MPPARILGAFAALAFLPLIGCAGVEYRERSTLSHTRYATIESYGDVPVLSEQVDRLVEEVATLLNVALDSDKPKVRIIVVAPSRISEIYQQLTMAVPHGVDAAALYLPGANVVLVPSFSRELLGHELAHYVTDHYLKGTPKRDWERIALRVERQIASGEPVGPPIAPRNVVARAERRASAGQDE